MRLSRRNLCCAAVLCSFFLLTSCSSHQKTTKHPSLGASNSGIASSEAPCALPSGDVEDVEESTLAEPEQSAKEEIAARTEQQKDLTQRVAEAEKRIASFREKALHEARDAAADLAQAIVNKLVA